MDRGADRGSSDRTRTARTLCLVPADLAGRLAGALREHFADSDVEVVVEGRSHERRSGAERRQADVPEQVPPAGDRRRIHNADGRRVADRRAPVTAASPPQQLPRRARRHAERLAFVERIEPSAEQLEDADTARLVIAFQAGDREVFSVLYRRYLDRIYGYLRLILRDSHEAEDLAQRTFLNVLSALPGYERRSAPFRSWLFRIARNQAITALADRERVEPVEDAAELLASVADERPQDPAASIPGWLSDGDLSIFIDRLPESQRQALFLRFALGLSSDEVAAVMGRTPKAVRRLHSRALATLRERLVAIGRGTGRHGRAAIRTRVARVSVIGARRYALGYGRRSIARSRPGRSIR